MDDEKIRQCFRKIEGKYEEPALKQEDNKFGRHCKNKNW
jgi:hypothetical protein